MAFEIVRLSTDTTPYLDRVAGEVFDNPINAAQLAAFMADPRHIMVLAIEEGAVVGMASGVGYFHPDKPPQMWINEAGVALTRRRRGIGKALTSALVHEARIRGCVYAWLGTAADNAAGQACFGSVPGVESPQPFLLYEWDLES